MSAITIRDMTRETGNSAAKKSAKASSVWFCTTVYHRQTRKMTEEGWEYVSDYEEFKEYLNERIAYFYQDKFVDLLRTNHPELAEAGYPELRFDIALEINVRGWLHHHATVEATYPRIVDSGDPQGRLMRWQLDYTAFNRVVREVMFPGGEVTLKAQVENVKTNSLENLKNYILKKQ